MTMPERSTFVRVFTSGWSGLLGLALLYGSFADALPDPMRVVLLVCVVSLVPLQAVAWWKRLRASGDGVERS